MIGLIITIAGGYEIARSSSGMIFIMPRRGSERRWSNICGTCETGSETNAGAEVDGSSIEAVSGDRVEELFGRRT